MAGLALGALNPLAAPAAATPGGVIVPAGQQCFTGIVQRRPEIGIPFAGTHLLVSAGGNVVASLVSSQVNLENLVGRTVTVCGFGQGVIEGVPAVAVTQVQQPGGVPQSRLTSLFACTAGVLAQGPLFFAPSPVNATLRTGTGDVLLIVPGAAPEALQSLLGQFVLACGFLTTQNELFVVILLPWSQFLGGGLLAQ